MRDGPISRTSLSTLESGVRCAALTRSYRLNALPVISFGMATGLACCVVLRFFWAHSNSRHSNYIWPTPSALNEILFVSLHAAFGAGIGLLFWLSWGFCAVVHLTWWQRGGLFGLINAVILIVLPVLMSHTLMKPDTLRMKIILINGVFTTIVTALAASWAWSQWL